MVKLQAGISHSGGSYGVNNALLELQLEPEDKVQSADQQLQSTIPGVRPVRAANSAARADSTRRRKGSDSAHGLDHPADVVPLPPPSPHPKPHLPNRPLWRAINSQKSQQRLWF